MDKVLMNEAREFFKRYKNDTTRKAYEKNYKKYIPFQKEKVWRIIPIYPSAKWWQTVWTENCMWRSRYWMRYFVLLREHR